MCHLPCAWLLFPTNWMVLLRVYVDISPLAQNGVGNTAMALFWCH